MSNDFELRKFVAPEFVFGHGACDLAGRYARNYGARKVLVVTDPGIIAAGWTDRVTASLTAARLPYVIFSQVTPNPRAEEVMAGAELYAASGCNVIVAVGGGSPMDCAKGIGIVSTNRRNILEFEGVDQVPIPAPPLICIPTTGGTSADVSQFAIIADRQERVKIAIISKTVVPDVALIDPLTLTTMPPYLMACTGLDALVHAIEAFVSNAHSPMTDLHALEAIRLISSNLIRMITTPTDAGAMSNVMLGSLQAGLAFSNASLGGVHALSHSLGGFLDLPHGECNALLLRHVMDFNLPEAVERYRQVGRALGLDLRGLTTTQQSHALLAEVDRLRSAVGITRTLEQVGVQRSDIPILARKAIKDACMVTNPRRPGIRDIEVIYEEAL
ncbi:1,3-propanediol dehydrogenase [Thermoflexales bacterium]|nr:1,3-propanediol dehydrogenase [Thermoflexales bacterium]